MKLSEMISAMQNAMLLHGDVPCRLYVMEDEQEYSAPIDMAVVEAEGMKIFYVAEYPTFKDSDSSHHVSTIGDDLN